VTVLIKPPDPPDTSPTEQAEQLQDVEFYGKVEAAEDWIR
jgi:hypothetical protein